MSAALTLHAWLSPAFPVGAFAYSHGLETAIAEGQVTDAQAVHDWIEACLCHGAGRTDALLMLAVMRGDDPAEVDDLACALAPSRERLLETEGQGSAFSETVVAAWGGAGSARAYPVAVGLAAREADLPETETAEIFLQAFCSNLVSAAIRLVPIGQTDGQRILSALQPVIAGVVAKARSESLDDIGGCTLLGDIASMRHETQAVRLFRS